MRSNDITPEKRKTGMVRVRGGFSDTTGIAPCNTILQVDEFDDTSRVLISNQLLRIFEVVFGEAPDIFDASKVNLSSVEALFCKSLLNDVFCERALAR